MYREYVLSADVRIILKWFKRTRTGESGMYSKAQARKK
jgi:hypothetical protein